MSSLTRAQAGAQLRRHRRQQSRTDGKAWTQQDAANAAQVSEKSIQRAELGGPVSTHVIQRLFEVYGVDYDQRMTLATAFNPIRIERPRLTEEERWEIRRSIRDLMLASEPLPSYVMDEYWFVRAFNVYMLALHGIPPAMLNLRETWHFIAIKFEPKINIRALRGSDWIDYYLTAHRRFLSATAAAEGTDRYRCLMKWLNGFSEFKKFSLQSARQVETEYRLALQKTSRIPIYHNSTGQWWSEVGGGFSPSRQLFSWTRSVWIPESKPGARNQMSRTLTRLSLDKAARKLGYDVRRKPVLFIEEYLSEAELRKIGGWID